MLNTQLPPINQRINQPLTILQPCTTRHPADDIETQLVPDLDGGDVVFEDEVEDGEFVALHIQLALYTSNQASRNQVKGKRLLVKEDVPISGRNVNTPRP